MTHYLHGHGPAVTAAHAGRTVANSAPHLVGQLKPGLAVLDVGSAGGALTRDLAAYVSPGQVIGLDQAADAVQQAQTDPSRPENLDYQVGDVYALPFPEQSFDLVHVHQVLHHLVDPVAALGELTRVTRSGGYLSLREADYGASFWYPETSAWDTWRQLFQALGVAGGTQVNAGRRLLTWLEQAGLTEAAGYSRTISASLWSYPGFAPVAEIAHSWAQRVTEPRLVERAQTLGLADQAALNQLASELVAWSAQAGAFFALPHVEVLIKMPETLR